MSRTRHIRKTQNRSFVIQQEGACCSALRRDRRRPSATPCASHRTLKKKQCGKTQGDRFKDTHGSAEMRPSHVTNVTGLVQHTLVKLASGLSLCVVCQQKLPRYACCLQQNRCLGTEGFSRLCSLQSKTSTLAVSSLAAPIEKFLVVVIWHRSWLRGSERCRQTLSWACHG